MYKYFAIAICAVALMGCTIEADNESIRVEIHETKVVPTVEKTLEMVARWKVELDDPTLTPERRIFLAAKIEAYYEGLEAAGDFISALVNPATEDDNGTQAGNGIPVPLDIRARAAAAARARSLTATEEAQLKQDQGQ